MKDSEHFDKPHKDENEQFQKLLQADQLTPSTNSQRHRMCHEKQSPCTSNDKNQNSRKVCPA